MLSLVRAFVVITSPCQMNRIQTFSSVPKTKGWLTRGDRIRRDQKKKREFFRREKFLDKFKNVQPLIECKNQEYNHYKDFTYGKFVPLPLATKGWYHRKSVGDYFTIYDPSPNEKEFQKHTVEVEQAPDLMKMEDFGFKDKEVKTNEALISFSDLGLSPELVKALQSMGIKKPSEIQREGIPAILSGRNVSLTAETGCGKTLAFLLPLVQHIMHYKSIKLRPKEELDSPFILILSPSRELTSQTFAVAQQLAKYVEFIPKLIIGGETSKSIRTHDFSEVDMVVGSSGAISKYITKGVLLTKYLQTVVLDEADSLLDENFSEKLVHLLKKKIVIRPKLSSNDAGVQIVMVSATMPETLSEKLNTVIPLESLIDITTGKVTEVLEGVKQKFIRVNHVMRASLLLELVKRDINLGEPVIIFSKDLEKPEALKTGSDTTQSDSEQLHHLTKRKDKNKLSFRIIRKKVQKIGYFHKP